MRSCYKPYLHIRKLKFQRAKLGAQGHTGSSSITIWTQVAWSQVSITTMLMLPPDWLFQQMQWSGKNCTPLNPCETQLKSLCQEKMLIMPLWLSESPGRSLLKVENQSCCSGPSALQTSPLASVAV